MSRLFITPRAAQDIEDICDYIAKDNPAAATRMAERLLQVAHLLRDNPRIGTARNDIAEGVRTFAVGRYLILFRALADGVEIVRFVHGARRLPGLV